MKERSGFVSNSSTSSFIIIGKPVTGEYEELEAMAEKLSLDFVSTDDGGYVGAVLASWDDNGDPMRELKLNAAVIASTFHNVAIALNIPESEVALYATSTYS